MVKRKEVKTKEKGRKYREGTWGEGKKKGS